MIRLLAACLVLTLFLMPEALARQNDERLDHLFAQLHATTDPIEARVIERRIWQVWTESGSETTDLLMRRGGEAMAAEEYDAALEILNRVVVIDPDFAEGWNRRATLYYLMGDFTASVEDIERTLELEPRHFGALSGLGLIYSALEQDELALHAFEMALEANPHLPAARAAVRRIKKRLENRGI